MKLKYKYICAWKMKDAFRYEDDIDTIELLKNDHFSFVVTKNPDPLLEELDKSKLAPWLFISHDFYKKIPFTLQHRKEQRKAKIKNHPVLIFQAEDDIEIEFKHSHHHINDFIINIWDDHEIDTQKRYQKIIESMKLSISLGTNNYTRFIHLTEGLFLYNNSGDVIYNLLFDMKVGDLAPAPFSNELHQKINSCYNDVMEDNEIDSVIRLFSQMSEYDDDKLKAYLFGWNAFEIFISKAFNKYEQDFLSPLINADQPDLRKRFTDRFREVMKDKYKLGDKFVVVTAVLFPGISEKESNSYYKRFMKLKKLRNNIFHGQAFQEENLPVRELSVLLRQYIKAHIQFAN